MRGAKNIRSRTGNNTGISKNTDVIATRQDDRSSTTSSSEYVPPNQGERNVNPLDVLSTLKIPDAIRFLPTYDGNPKTLNEFVTNVEEILALIRGTSRTPYGQLLLRSIRNKIEGKASEGIIESGASLNWEEIKAALILHCADKRDEPTLMFELHNSVQEGHSLRTLYDKVGEIKLALFRIAETTESEQIVVKTKKKLFADICLNSFLTGIRGPLGATIRSMKPTNLREAFEWALKEKETFFAQTNMKRPEQKQEYGARQYYIRSIDYKQIRGNNERRSHKRSGYDRNDNRGNDERHSYKRYRNDYDNMDNNYKRNNMLAIMPKDNNYNNNNQQKQSNRQTTLFVPSDVPPFRTSLST